MEYVRRLAKYRNESGDMSEVLLTSTTDISQVKKMAKRRPVSDTMAERKGTSRTPEARAMDELHVNRYCCRRHFLCDIDIIDIQRK